MKVTSDNAFHLSGVSVHFASLQAGRVQAVCDIDFAARSGECVCFVGPSGCGKTTLLRAIGGIIPVSGGTVSVAGGLGPGLRQHNGIAYVFQDPILLPWRSVRRNAELAGDVECDSAVKNRALEWLNRLGLGHFLDSHPRELSGGMRSRVALARALSLSPKLLLMDEPFADLDETTRYQMDLQLQELWQSAGSTIVLVTHSVREALLLADRVVVLSERPGRIKEIIPVDLPRPRTERIFANPVVLDQLSHIRSLISSSIAVPAQSPGSASEVKAL